MSHIMDSTGGETVVYTSAAHSCLVSGGKVNWVSSCTFVSKPEVRSRKLLMTSPRPDTLSCNFPISDFNSEIERIVDLKSPEAAPMILKEAVMIPLVNDATAPRISGPVSIMSLSK